jgi:hypothetical protein
MYFLKQKLLQEVVNNILINIYISILMISFDFFIENPTFEIQ